MKQSDQSSQFSKNRRLQVATIEVIEDGSGEGVERQENKDQKDISNEANNGQSLKTLEEQTQPAIESD